jgi:hypothetical protein
VKPSEFWTRVIALPEQARKAETMALDLREAADALCTWGRLAMINFERSKEAADSGDMAAAEDWLNRVPPHPNDPPGAAIRLSEPPTEDAVRPRKQRSDAGKPRKGKSDGAESHAVAYSMGLAGLGAAPVNVDPVDEDDGGSAANPADVKARDAARVKLAGEIRRFMATAAGPQTLAGIELMLPGAIDQDEISGALKLLSLVSWRMQREGDSQPVEVWGTVYQFAQLVGRMSVKSGDRVADTMAKYGCSEFDAKRVWKELDPRGAL